MNIIHYSVYHEAIYSNIGGFINEIWPSFRTSLCDVNAWAYATFNTNKKTLYKSNVTCKNCLKLLNKEL